MRQIKFLVIFCMSVLQGLAQNYYHETQEAQTLRINKSLGELPSSDKVKQLASAYLDLPDGISLDLFAEKKSKAGTYYTFFLSVDDVQVYNHQVKVFVRNDAQLRYISHNIEQELLPVLARQKYVSIENYNPSAHEQMMSVNPTFFRWKGVWESAKSITLKNTETQYAEEVIIGKGQEVLFRRELSMEVQDSAVVKVFNPDPLTSAAVAYDTQQLDTSFLNTQLFFHKVPAEKSNDTFYLRNSRMYLTNISSPMNTPTIAVGKDTFNMAYKQPGFNDVMVFYHINNMIDRIHALGFTGLPAYQIQVDPYALADGENSTFTYSDVPPSLQFGKGLIYDAEDADVIVHELSHAFSHSAAPGTDLGLERLSIEEGQADYFAASYSKRISTYNWQKVFNWDGNGFSWKGRTVAWPNNYPANGIVSGLKWTNGQYWSTAMMRIWDSCGADTADMLMLEALHSLVSNIKMPQLAEMVLEADTNLFGGSHTREINCAFYYSRILLTDDSVLCPPKPVGIYKPAARQPEVLNSFAFAQGTGSLEVVVPGNLSLSHYEIYDVQGRKIYVGEAGNQRMELSPASIKNPGIYFLRIYYRDNSTAAVKLLRY